MYNNIQNSNGVTVSGNKVIINGIELPPTPSNGNNSSVTTINNKVYINGYEFKDGNWRKTLKALWYQIF